VAVAAMLANRTERLPELQVWCTRIAESGVRRAERPAREVGRANSGHGERRGTPNV